MTRLRIASYLVQPQAFTDDGDILSAVPVQPVTVSAAEWPKVVELMAVAVEHLRVQVEGPPQFDRNDSL